MKVSVFLTILGSVTGALAGCNCKCQDPSGTGPQWNDLTEEACDTQLPGESGECLLTKVYHGDQHHQCSSFACCIDSGGFNQFCKDRGAPGAFCW
ncbi:hypothetical protein QBC32DRAFT_225552 [Pseudoneurospora amorphoporcata]|uniref:Uncharacterized protein n=1 Tax=Pseudoneurospora amorphoporcata TaxID=241081 RepID=A0AAN6SAP8_9PEZI|nr:hypothetical protein QBC32DRAFT_319746 [Pseudoneurospora amorphoporcata]KAK3946745.1 hypothetical protein QBC32DRAFT_225552 [Pseudoneurospora amorphoporcata]